MLPYQELDYRGWILVQKDPSLQSAIEGAIAAGRLLYEAYRKGFKGEIFVGHTENPAIYIAQSERLMAEAITRTNPDDLIIGKTINQQADHAQGRVWLENGIDGFANFANGLEPCDVMVAQTENGDLIKSVVYDFLHGEVFYAVRGEESYKNGRRLIAPNVSMEKSTIISYAPLIDRSEDGSPEDKILVHALWKGKERIAKRFKQFQREYQAGGLELCWVAEGRLQGYASSWTTRHNLLSALNVQEAKGIATDAYGNNFRPGNRGVIAGAPEIQPVMLKVIQRYL